MEFNFNELRELLSVLNGTDIEELTIKSDDLELTVRKGLSLRDRLSSPLPTAEPSTPAVMPVSPPMSSSGAPSPVPVPPPSVIEQQLLNVNSPMVGTFYRAPAPDESPFVDVGDRISPGQTVCIIEAMKLMNELEAEISGEIVEILVQNGEPVEFGQTLMRVKPA